MSLGKPAVVTSVGGIPSMVLDHKTGLVVPPNDPQRLAQALTIMIEQPDLAARFGRAAKDRYEACYTPEIMARSLETMFSKICSAHYAHA